MQKVINKQPVNKDFFQNILSFAEQILAICKELRVTPIVYGSLAYFFHTEDETLPVNDIDFLVPESSFAALMDGISKIKGVKYQKMPYHSIEVFKDGIELDFDSMEHFLGKRPKDSTCIEINAIELQILNRDSLASIYQEALDNMPMEKRLNEKGSNYQRKLDNLRASK